jgi:hypothetical protein
MVSVMRLPTCCQLTLLVFMLLAAPAARGTTLPEGAVLLDDDVVGDLHRHSMFAVSPNSRRVAYISRGALWVASVDQGPATRAAELPNTLTEALLDSGYAAARTGFNRVGATGRPGDYDPRGPSSGGLTVVGGLQWSADGESVLLMTRNLTGERPSTRDHTVWEVSTTGDRRALGRIVREDYERPDFFWDFAVTQDRHRAVLFAGIHPHSAYPWPLFWDLVADRPIATAYDRLFAAPSRRRFLAEEIDTRQWVVLDEELNVTRRLDATHTSESYPQTGFWSPDEEQVVVVAPLPLPARREAEAFLIDLTTGRTPLLCGCDETDRFLFTGRRDEALHIGTSGILVGGKSDGGDGAFVSRVVGDAGREEKVVGFVQRPPWMHWSGKHKPYPMPCVSPDGRRIAIALPRPDGALGYRYWLVDQKGSKTPLAEDDPALYYSPYRVLAFVDGGKRLLAFDYEQLFTVPVDTIFGVEPPEE